MEENPKDMLTEIMSASQLTYANGWKRFANFLIDYVVYYIILVVIIVLLNFTGLPVLSENGNGDFIILIASLLVFVAYYTLFEMLTNGRTIGKLITGTRAVNDDGTDMTIGTAFKRSLSRIVPFEIFSALGSPSYPWHDKWNHTYVIDIKKSTIISGVSEIAG